MSTIHEGGHPAPEPENGGQDPQAGSTRRHWLWRVARAIGLVALCALTAVIVGAAGARWYFSDEKIKAIAAHELTARLDTAVTIGSFELSLLDGLEIKQLRVAAPEGFTAVPLEVERIALHWSLLSLLRLHLRIPEVALEGIELRIEKTGSGSFNLERLASALGRTGDAGARDRAEQEEAPAHEKEDVPGEKMQSIEQPSLPIAVELERFVIDLRSLELIAPDMHAHLQNGGVRASFEGEGQALDFALWAGLGEPEPAGAPSRLRLSGDTLPGKIDSQQRIGITVTSTGFGDIAVELDLDVDARVLGEAEWPPLTTSAKLRARADLLRQRAELHELTWQLGEKTRFALSARAEHLLGDVTVLVDELSMSSDFAELEPLLRAVIGELDIGGNLTVQAEPFTLPTAAEQLADAHAQLSAQLTDLTLTRELDQIADLDLSLGVTLEDGLAKVKLDTALANATSGPQRVADLKLDVTATSPIAPWLTFATDVESPAARRGNTPLDLEERKARVEPLTDEGAGRSVRMDVQLSLREARAADAKVSGLSMDLSALAMPQWFEGESTEAPLDAKVDIRLERADAGFARASDFHLGLHTEIASLSAERLSAQMSAELGTVAALAGDDKIELSNASFSMDMGRNADLLQLSELSFSLAEILAVRASGSISEAFSDAPHAHDLTVDVGPVELERALQLLPASQRPPLDIGGSVGAKVRVDGELPYVRLLAEHPPPKTPERTESGDVAEIAQVYLDYALGWQDTLAAGLASIIEITVQLMDVEISDPTSEIEDLDLELSLIADGHSFGLDLITSIGSIHRPVQLESLRSDWRMRFDDKGISVGLSANVVRFREATLVAPLTDATLDMGVRYKLGGDLLLDALTVSVPSHGIESTASGAIAKPLRAFVRRAWESPKMPGMEARLGWQASIDFGSELTQLTRDGPKLNGGATVTGNLRVEDGILKLSGNLQPQQLSAVVDLNVVESINGDLPFEVKLAFDPRDDVTVLRRNGATPLGSGVIALATSDTDVRERAARPAYYPRLLPYRSDRGITIQSIRTPDLEISDVVLDARLVDGMLLVDWLAMHLLGGDINGNMALQLGRDASVRADLALKLSNIDASYFKALDITPGEDSELNADMQLSFLAAPDRRDLQMDMNVTKIRRNTLNNFLLWLNQHQQDDNLESTRKKLWMVRLNGVKTWIRYENFNMDLAVATFLRVPFTSIGFPHIDREVLRRYSLTETLDAYAQPYIDSIVGEALGWRDES